MLDSRFNRCVDALCLLLLSLWRGCLQAAAHCGERLVGDRQHPFFALLRWMGWRTPQPGERPRWGELVPVPVPRNPARPPGEPHERRCR
jgi:hypothetical protein